MVFAEQPNMSEPNAELKNFPKNYVIAITIGLAFLNVPPNPFNQTTFSKLSGSLLRLSHRVFSIWEMSILVHVWYPKCTDYVIHFPVCDIRKQLSFNSCADTK